MKRFTFFKTLLVAAGLLGGVNVWADVTYNFEGDTPTNPFTNADGTRMTMNVIEDATLSSHVVKFDRNRSGYVAFAYYDFSSALVENASTVTIEFDYYVKSASGHDVISISDGDLHTLSAGDWTSGSNTGYGNNGVIFNLGCFRANNNNKYEGYKIDSTNPATVPDTVDSGTTIKVYYVIDENQTKELSYTVEYYKDNVKVEI